MNIKTSEGREYFLSRSEREIHISKNMEPDSKWHVFTDDSVWVRRLTKLFGEPLRVEGASHFWEVEADLLKIHKKKVTNLTEEQKEARRLRMRKLRSKS